jgi:hypothetical protein
MAINSSECALVDRERLMVSYLAGKLSAADAEVFEAHYFGCDQCWEELQDGLAIRAAMAQAKPRTAPSVAVATKATRQPSWRWLAAAAAVVLAAGIWSWLATHKGPASANPAMETAAAPPAPSPAIANAPPATELMAQTPKVGAPSRVPPKSAARANVTTPEDATLRSAAEAGFKPKATREANGEIRITWTPVDHAASYVLTVFASDGTQVHRQEVASPPMVLDAQALSRRSVTEKLFGQVEAVNALGAELSTSARFDLPARREGDLP